MGDEEEAKASVEIWRYALGFAEMAAVKCAIELKIPEAVENQTSQPVTLADLSSAVGFPPPLLRRIMRFLAHQGIFKAVPTKDGATGYTNTPLSRRMMITNRDDKSMAHMILLSSNPVAVASYLKLSSAVVSGKGFQPFEAAHGKDAWAYAAEDPGYRETFNEAMACDTRRVVPAVTNTCADIFDGVSTVVDVGCGTGEAMGMVVKAFPWIKAFNFDLPHVMAGASEFEGVENVAGDMFGLIPRADAVFIKWILHDWSDEDCVKILKRSREAVPKEKGKVIIVEAVVEQKKEDDDDDKLEYARLLLDVVMMAQMKNGRERNMEEWDHLLTEAGFVRHEVRDINDLQSVIIAYVS
ncbi:PREDICTED: (RS)-norcoclaurine 6-O-methyltransferase-like [Tarenaya hassleriana]|uniref:(RS)-norcoclaurine 6-O-methyltransferase-like n=1 Tax=Tarenaya hassleriana TaxID=28532 RepID=UPI00053C1714|nr:PREDICTED: (RS)-norcoclaurine 6-O-methyltransferase-like [Tarenaya hassleriana]